ncbi:peptide deformylase, partial [Stenotrophomonas sp. 3diitr2024]|uniref:peptide deformylase n=1 Tax=Stenotrophomonas sp. 3diitr2024 TaxID=3345115 RepID=UPI0035CC9D76
VTRADTITVKYLDRNGQEQQLEAGEVLATCIQHEMDHLDTVLMSSKPYSEACERNREPIATALDPWMGDRQTFQVMPSASRGVPDADRRKRALSFDRRHESAR